MGHILGSPSHGSIATLVGLLLAMTMEIWDRECGPFRPIFAVFAILGQVGNTISPTGKGPSQEGAAIPVRNNQGSIALEVCICSCGLAGVMQLTMPATLPKFALLLFSAPLCDHPIGEQQAANVTASQTPMHWTKGVSKPVDHSLFRRDCHKSQPWSATRDGRFCQLWHPDARESEGGKLHRASRELILEGYRAGCFPPTLAWPGRGVNVGHLQAIVRMGSNSPFSAPNS